jgi:hypothetical protein
VLGCLVEKQLTTPQQYPLTLNALTAATNQATNRDPVVVLEDDAVLAAVDELRSRHLARIVHPSHGRSVKRYRHVLDETYGLDAARSALLATLILRGPQTVGELRARTERMVDLSSADDVQAELAALSDHPEGLVRLQPRRPGQKEDRWVQLLAAPWDVGAGPVGGDEAPRPEGDDGFDGGAVDEGEPGKSAGVVSATADRQFELEVLRTELAALREAVSVLREEFDALRHGLGD